MQNSIRSMYWLLAFGVLSGLPIAAQDASGRIMGVVTDPSGSPIPNAKVTVTNVETGISSEALTKGDGSTPSTTHRDSGQRTAGTVGGWTISPVFSFGSGLPLQIITGSFQEQGNGFDGNISATAIPISGNGSSLGNSVHMGVNRDGVIGVNGDASQGAARSITSPTRRLFITISGRSFWVSTDERVVRASGAGRCVTTWTLESPKTRGLRSDHGPGGPPKVMKT